MDNLLTKVLDSSINSIIVLRTVKNEAGEVLDFEYTLLNKSAEEVLGLSKEELIGKKISEHYPRCREVGIMDFYIEVYTNKISKKNRFCFEHDNVKSWCEISATEMGDCIVATFMNVSEKIEKESQIKENEELLKEVQELSLLGYFEWNIEENKTFWSDQIYKMYGYNSNDIQLSFENSIANIVEEDRGYIRNLLNSAKEGAFEFQDYQYQFIRKDGTTGTALGKARTIKDKDGKVVKLRGFIQDITERVKQESLLWQCQHLSHTCSWECDFNTNKVSGTPEFYSIFNIINRELTYNEFLSFIVPSNRNLFIKKVEEAIKTKSAIDFKFNISLKDKFVKNIWFMGKVAFSSTGKPLRMFGTLMDITKVVKTEEELKSLYEGIEDRIKSRTEDLEKANEELLKINNELSKFSYTISHDLKAPLNTIEPLAYFLKEKQEAVLDKESKVFLDLIIDRVHHMGDLIKNILASAKTKNKVKEECNTYEIISTVVTNSVVPDNIYLAVQNSLPVVHYNKTSLMQVFQNLLSNSIKFMDKEKGIIKIGCERINEQYRFYVYDNGSGIKKSDFEKIFGEFEIVHEKLNIESTGLGLSIVKKIIEENGGTIWVESEEGKGSTFFFTIPVS